MSDTTYTSMTLGADLKSLIKGLSDNRASDVKGEALSEGGLKCAATLGAKGLNVVVTDRAGATVGTASVLADGSFAARGIDSMEIVQREDDSTEVADVRRALNIEIIITYPPLRIKVIILSS